jgi:MSHA biogenesis protein MshJ
VNKYWQDFAARIDAMTLRERAVIFGAAAAVLVAIAYSFWIDREFAKSARLAREIAQRQGEMKSLQDQMTRLASAREADPDRASRERLAALNGQLAEIEAAIAAEERKFTAPDKMRAVLEELLARNRAVSLLSLKTLPVTSIAEERASAAPGAGGKPAAPAGRLIFRHAVELTVTGGYLDILAYLSDLERLPTQLYWGAMGLDAQYPVATVKITVHTLSLDRAWLSV